MSITTAGAVVLGGGAPAAAADGSRAERIIQAAYEAYTAVQGLDGDPAGLDEAISTIVDVAGRARPDLVTEVDDPAAAEVRACAMSALHDIASIRTMTSTHREGFASQAVACVNTAKNVIQSIGRLEVANQAAFALNLVGPVALVARARQGLPGDAVRQQIIAANRTNLARLAPACAGVPVVENNQISEWLITCTSFAGAAGQVRVAGPVRPTDYTAAEGLAMRSTSYQQSLGVLTRLTV